MCSPARCRRCGGTTWTGCGAHVSQVMAGVPKDRRCTCDADRAAGRPTSSEGGSWLDRLRGR